MHEAKKLDASPDVLYVFSMRLAADPRSQMLAEMASCAHRIGMAFGRDAEQASDGKARAKLFLLFERCYFAIRVSTALELRLKRQWGREDREPATDRERLIDPPEREERDDSLDYTERERDRETERASFPLLLKALDGVVADAAARPGPQPAELPKLRDLLAHARSSQPTAGAPPRPTPTATLRSRLTGAGAAAPPAPERRPASNVGEVLAARRARRPP